MIAALRRRNLTITIVEALATVIAAAVVLISELPLWAMFVGWISYFTRGITLRDGLFNYAGVIIGLLIGLGAASVLARLGPEVGLSEQLAVVFGVALLVLSLRFLPKANNLLAFFLGIVTFFAAHAEPNFLALVPLAAAAAVGATAGAIAHNLQTRLGASRS